MRTALISGITGQTGSYIAEQLLAYGYQVHGLVRRSSTLNRGRIDHLKNVLNPQDGQLFLHYADLSDTTQIRRILLQVNPDEFYHLAGQSHVGLSFDLAESTCLEIAFSTLSILEILRDLSNPPRFFHASSSEVFGASANTPQNEMSAFRPLNPYGCAKAFATNIIRVYRDSYGLYLCNGILYNHESPRRGENFVTKKIAMAAAGMSRTKTDVLELGNLSACRDWGYAPEFASGIIKSLQVESPSDYVFSTGVLTSVRQFAKSAFHAVGVDIAFEGSGTEEVAFECSTGMPIIRVNPRFYRPLDSNNLVGDSSKASEILKWSPSTVGPDVARVMALAEVSLA